LEWNKEINAGCSITFGFGAESSIQEGDLQNCQIALDSSNDQVLNVVYDLSGSSNTANNDSSLKISTVDDNNVANQITIKQGEQTFTLSQSDLSTFTNNSTVISAVVKGSELSITGLQAGRAGLKIGDRWIGVRVLDSNGEIPGMPNYLSIGSVSEDSVTDLAFWQTAQ